MSDIGLFLIVCAGLLLLLGVIRVLAWLTDVQDEHGSLGRASVNTLRRYVVPRPRVMSRSEAENRPVLRLVPAVPVPGTPPSSENTHRNLTEDEVIKMLALARDDKGIYRYSGKKIYALVGGNYGQFLATMRELRDDAVGDMPEASYVTPIVGRSTSARFETDADHPYQAPN